MCLPAAASKAKHWWGPSLEYPHSPRILAVFENDKALGLTQRHLSQRTDFGAEFTPFFFFQTLPGMMEDFRQGWRRIGDGARLSGLI
jgi:hypothetical protein